MKEKKNEFSQKRQRKPARIYCKLPSTRSNFQRRIVATIPALADFLKISETTVKRYKSNGYIPYLQADGSGHRVLFFIDDVIQALQHFKRRRGK